MGRFLDSLRYRNHHDAHDDLGAPDSHSSSAPANYLMTVVLFGSEGIVQIRIWALRHIWFTGL